MNLYTTLFLKNEDKDVDEEPSTALFVIDDKSYVFWD